MNINLRVLVALVGLLCAFSVGFVLNLASEVFIPLVIAWFMLQIFRPIISLGRKIKLPPAINTVLVFTVFFSLCYIGIVFCTTQIVEFNRAFITYQAKLYDMTVDIMKALQIPPESLPRMTWMDFFGRYIRNISELAFALSSKFVLTLVFFFFMLMESPYFDSKIERAFSGQTAVRVKNIVSSINIETSR